MATRTHPIIGNHLQGVLDAIDDLNLPFPVGEWQRPLDGDERFVDPPYVLVRVFPSTAQFEGPISDSQADVVMRFQIMGVGFTQRQAIDITDLCKPAMQRRLVTVVGRRVQDIRYMITSGGVSRDDDQPTPFFYSSDLFEMLTTPS